MGKGKDGVVKVDSELLEKVEKLIKKNKFVFSNYKQVVNLALVEFLNKHNFRINEKKRYEKR